MTVVNQGDRRGQKTLAGSEIVLKDGQGLVHLVLSHKVHGKVLDRHGQIKQSPVGTVGRVDDGICLALRQSLEELQSKGGLVLPFWRQVALHAANKGPGADREALEVGVADLLGGLGAVVKCVAHSDEITGVVAMVGDGDGGDNIMQNFE